MTPARARWMTRKGRDDYLVRITVPGKTVSSCGDAIRIAHDTYANKHQLAAARHLFEGAAAAATTARITDRHHHRRASINVEATFKLRRETVRSSVQADVVRRGGTWKVSSSILDFNS